MTSLQGHRDPGGGAVPASGADPALAAADGGHHGARRRAGAPPRGEGLPQVTWLCDFEIPLYSG